MVSNKHSMDGFCVELQTLLVKDLGICDHTIGLEVLHMRAPPKDNLPSKEGRVARGGDDITDIDSCCEGFSPQAGW